MRTLNQGLKDYVALKKAMGFSFKRQEYELRQFATFMKQKKQKFLTTELATTWALKGDESPKSWHASQLSVLHAFALYWRTIEPKTEIWPENLWPMRYQRKKPYIYSEDEIRRLLKSCLELAPTDGLRPLTFYTLFGLIAACGLRLSEALTLKDGDVDLNHGVITVRKTKFNKTRIIPVHETTIVELRKYALARKKYRERYLSGHQCADLFFVTNDEMPISNGMAEWTHNKIALNCGVRSTSRQGPRLHDLRHTFVVRRLENWYRKGKNVEALLSVLSTYVGHENPGSTFWYMTITPELMGLASNRLDRYMGGLSQ